MNPNQQLVNLAIRHGWICVPDAERLVRAGIERGWIKVAAVTEGKAPRRKRHSLTAAERKANQLAAIKRWHAAHPEKVRAYKRKYRTKG
jgi:hypothetical protein